MLQQNPDIILRTSHAMPEEVMKNFETEFAQNDIWSKFSAVQNGKVYNLDNNYLKAINNRICLGILGQGLNLMESKKSRKGKQIKRMLSSKRYRDAYKQFELKFFPIYWKIFYGLAKYNVAYGVYAMLICIKRMIGR